MNNEQVKEPLTPVGLTLEPDLLRAQGQEQHVRLRAGDLCPTCRSERLDYDGLLNLACPKCGYALSGCFT